MRKQRSMIAALVAAIGVVLALAAPVTAAAAPSAGEAATAVQANEEDRAVEVDGPPRGAECHDITGARVCFVPDGDQWYVRDTDEDSASADAVWVNYRNGEIYRTGICRNALGEGKWGVCNKNYFEGSEINYYVRVFDYTIDHQIRRSGLVVVFA
jgi:hypothetical protein